MPDLLSYPGLREPVKITFGIAHNAAQNGTLQSARRRLIGSGFIETEPGVQLFLKLVIAPSAVLGAVDMTEAGATISADAAVITLPSPTNFLNSAVFRL